MDRHSIKFPMKIRRETAPPSFRRHGPLTCEALKNTVYQITQIDMIYVIYMI